MTFIEFILLNVNSCGRIGKSGSFSEARDRKQGAFVTRIDANKFEILLMPASSWTWVTTKAYWPLLDNCLLGERLAVTSHRGQTYDEFLSTGRSAFATISIHSAMGRDAH